MSFNLGNWKDKLKCDVCEKPFEDLFGGPPEGSGVLDPSPDDAPDGFWDPPPDPPGGPFDDIDIPDLYPYGKPADGGWGFGVGGKF